MAKTWIKVLQTGTNAEKWGVPADTITELEELEAEASKWLERGMSSDRNAVITSQMNVAFSKLIAHMRDMKNRHFFTPPLTEPDIVSLDLRPKDTIRTPIADPTGQAEADVTYPGPHLLMLHLKALEGTLIDPRADHGYRIYYGVMPTGGASVEEATGKKRYLTKAAATGEDLPHSKFSRKTKVLMEFDAADSGKTAYFSVRFENAKGGKGPWGPVFSATIP
jgi:hypothetical protein